ncbi:replication factor C small subunit [Haloplanus vescus]|uniref:Replication factor C small subunit n=1 Tax=Haloplanus vescus TaxID=555874 RepID=A0A1H3ZHD6_9EURY|nr:AAA family ATPase [Haloplanus vescus]SEA22752.1 replication factor C small subunit [Haloplanus vescus]
MDAPLWTETHTPSLGDLPQDSVRDRLERAVDEPMNLVVQGPPGSGKTAAVRALADTAHDDANDLVEINVADFFDRTKKEIREDPRFAQFLSGRSRMAKRDMINRVLKESASYAPVSGDYKTIVLDNAEAIREDFQQALRRVMEQHHRTTQFVLVTRQPSTLIAPIRSRCFPVPVRAPTAAEIETVLERILDAEGVDYDDDGVEFVAGYADGDLRKAILGAQTTAMETAEVTMTTVHETLADVGHDDALAEVWDATAAGEVTDARKTVETLLDDEGYDGQSLLVDLLETAQKRYDGDTLARLHRLAGDIDHDLVTGSDDRLHLTHLLATWAQRAEA